MQTLHRNLYRLEVKADQPMLASGLVQTSCTAAILSDSLDGSYNPEQIRITRCSYTSLLRPPFEAAVQSKPQMPSRALARLSPFAGRNHVEAR
jgi:hypothetical protein